MKLRDRQILNIALPSIVSNITVPLLGLIDVAITGHLGSAAYIGAIAVGGMLFNIIYWMFAFLRMGTSGMTAQAFGARNLTEVVNVLLRALFVSLAISAVMLCLQVPVRELSLSVIMPSEEVATYTRAYFNICIWGAPAALSLFALTGWYVGMQNSKIPMVVAITQNVANILVSLLLVYGLNMKIEGVALGTVTAQYIGLIVALFLLVLNYLRLRRYMCLKFVLAGGALLKFFSLNKDIFLRTCCLILVHFFFISAGAKQGETELAVNTMLMQLFTLYSYIMDGFAFAGEALGGKYWGAGDAVEFRRLLRRLFLWGAGMTMLFSTVYIIGGMPFLRLLTDEPMVVEASRQYVWWAYLIPVAGVAAFVWDGLFIGITYSRGMLQSSCLAAVVFFSGVFLLMPEMGNHGLWLSMILYLMARGLLQTVLFFRTKVKYDGTDTKFL